MRLVIGLALSVSTCVACGGGEQPRDATTTPEVFAIPVAARPAEIGSIRSVLHASGIVTPAPGAEFLAVAPEPARIIEVTHAEGAPVAAGDLLVRLDIPSASANTARQRAETARARSDLENARANQVRAREFAERGLIARRELEDAERTLADAQTALARAEAAQSAADAAATRSMIRAPFSGVIAQRLHNPGDVVSGAATGPILRLVDPTRLEVIATVPVSDLSRVLPGATARLAGFGDTGAVRFTVASRSGAGGAAPAATVPVRLTPVDPLRLAVDTPVQVDIDLDERANVVLVTPESIVREGKTAAVFVAAGDRAERREVTTGVIDDRQVEITSGVRAGELVITRGHSGLEDGALISVDAAAR